jgi:hypothetical protein
MRRPVILALLLLGLSSTAGAVPLTITVAAGSAFPPLDPCFADCHWEPVIPPRVEPATLQTAAEWLEDLLHEPAWIDLELWCPQGPPGPVPPSTGPPGPGMPRTPTGPPVSPTPTSVPPGETPPEPVGEAATGILLLVSLGALTIERRRAR